MGQAETVLIEDLEAEAGDVRILHLINHCRFGHGNVHAAVDLACAQLQAGDEAIIASGHGEFEPLLREQGVEHILLDQEGRKPLRLLANTLALRRLINRIKPDIVHAHMMNGAITGWLATRATRARLVTTVHNAFDGHSILMGLGDRMIGVSEAVTQNMIRRGVSKSKARTVLNGTLGAPRRDFFGTSPISLEKPNVGTVCGLHDRKGVSDLIAGFDLAHRAIPQLRLYIAGEGPHEANYRVQAAALPSADRIHFLGQVHDTKSLLREFDVFVLASHADPAPLVIPEAREAGCAMVATAVDGIPELMDGGRAGALVPPKDPEAIGQAIMALHASADALQAGRDRSLTDVDHWSTRRVAAQTREVYQELL